VSERDVGGNGVGELASIYLSIFVHDFAKIQKRERERDVGAWEWQNGNGNGEWGTASASLPHLIASAQEPLGCLC
jgi:hypothetical protein